MKPAFLLPVFAALSIPGAAAAQSTADFNWRGESFSLAIPAGYCLPKGEQIAITQATAAGDSQNETVVHLERCGTFGEDYILIKTPRNMPPLTMPKAQFIDLVSDQFTQENVQDGIDQGSEDVSNMSDGKLSISQRDYGFVGTDDECVIMAGSMELRSREGAVEVRVGSCLTLVGTRNFAIHSYDNRPDGAGAQTLSQRSRQVAVAISLK